MNAIIFCLLFTTVTATYEVFGKGIEHRNEHLIINQLDIIPVESTPTPNRASRVQKRLCGRRLILFMLATCGECDTGTTFFLSIKIIFERKTLMEIHSILENFELIK